VIFLGKGSGGHAELEKLFEEKSVVYSVLGIAAPGEGDYTVTRYLFLTWVGPSVKTMLKARSSQHRVSLYNFINKYVNLTGEVSAQTKEEITEKKVLEKLWASRQESAQPFAQSGSAATVSPVPGRGGTAKAKEQFEIHNETELVSTIGELRDDSKPTKWIVFGQNETSKDAITILGTGSGNVEELRDHFKDSDIAYALLSILIEEKDAGDEYKTNKVIFISWVGPDAKPMVKARSSQTRLALYTYVKKYITVSGEYQALSSTDLSTESIIQKVKLT